MTTSLTRAQALEILRAPRGARLQPFADRFRVSIDFIKHIRYKCRWMLRGDL